MENIGQRLKVARESAHVTQLELAKMMNVSPGIISMWETQHRNIRAVQIEQAAGLLNVPVSQLMGEHVQTPSEQAKAPKPIAMSLTFVEKTLVEHFRRLPENVQLFQLAQIVECTNIIAEQAKQPAGKKPRRSPPA